MKCPQTFPSVVPAFDGGGSLMGLAGSGQTSARFGEKLFAQPYRNCWYVCPPVWPGTVPQSIVYVRLEFEVADFVRSRMGGSLAQTYPAPEFPPAEEQRGLTCT